MTEIILGLIIIGLLIFIFYKDRDTNRQVNRLIQGIIAKSSQEYVNMTLSEKTKLDLENKPPLGPVSDQFVPMGSTDPDLFDRMIEEQLKPSSGQAEEAEEEPNESTSGW